MKLDYCFWWQLCTAWPRLAIIPPLLGLCIVRDVLDWVIESLESWLESDKHHCPREKP